MTAAAMIAMIAPVIPAAAAGTNNTVTQCSINPYTDGRMCSNIGTSDTEIVKVESGGGGTSTNFVATLDTAGKVSFLRSGLSGTTLHPLTDQYTWRDIAIPYRFGTTMFGGITSDGDIKLYAVSSDWTDITQSSGLEQLANGRKWKALAIVGSTLYTANDEYLVAIDVNGQVAGFRRSTTGMGSTFTEIHNMPSGSYASVDLGPGVYSDQSGTVEAVSTSFLALVDTSHALSMYTMSGDYVERWTNMTSFTDVQTAKIGGSNYTPGWGSGWGSMPLYILSTSGQLKSYGLGFGGGISPSPDEDPYNGTYGTFDLQQTSSVATASINYVTGMPISINTPPTIQGATDITINTDAQFDPRQGVTATDAEDGDLTYAIQISGNVDTDTPGSYTLTYTVTDSGGLTATATRTITVQSTGTTIACAPQTGDPAASIWQWSSLIIGMMTVGLGAYVCRLQRRVKSRRML